MRGIALVIIIALLLLGAGCAGFTLSLVLLYLSTGGSLASLPPPGPVWFLLVPLLIIAANLHILIATEGYKRWNGDLPIRVTTIAIVSLVVGILLVIWIYWPSDITAVTLPPVSQI
jgi:hypothetical protein